jgi:hypothetical protein
MSVDSQIKEVVQESREWVEDQVEQLSEQVQKLQKQSRKQVQQLQRQSRKQVKQLQKQSRKLRKNLRREVRKRRKYWTAFRVALLSLKNNMLKRGEYLTEGLVERGGKVTQNVLDFGGKTTQDLAERGGKVTQNVLDFGGKTTQDLAERSGEFTQELAKRGQRLLAPVRRRDRTFWSIVGFGIGLVAAATITYQLIRRRVAQQEIEQDEHIELPQNNSWNGSGGRPAGEINYLDQGGISVATLEIVDVKTVDQPADAAFVGVGSTKRYYPVETKLEPEDLVYFASEEEAKAQGFTAAE